MRAEAAQQGEDDQTAEKSDRTAERYDRVAGEYDEARAGLRWRLYEEATKRAVGAFLPPPGAHVLDAGAGTGIFSLWLARKGYHVTLLDVSGGMLQKARLKMVSQGFAQRSRFLLSSIERIPCAGSTFDFVLCEGDPLSYCRPPRLGAARELVRVLKPGGSFYVACDSRWFGAMAFLWGDRIEEALGCARSGRSLDPYGDPVHAFDPQELKDLFLAAGAQGVQVSGKLPLSSLVPEEKLAAWLEDGRKRELLWALEEAVSRQGALAGLAPHLQVTGMRPEEA